MRVWTIQHPDFEKEINHHRQYGGLIYRQIEHAMEEPEFQQAYRWMKEQLRKRVTYPRHTRITPFWLWLQWESETKPKPDLRFSAHGRAGQPYVLVELEIPDYQQHLLISDFHLWHYVINRWYIPASEDDSNAFEEQFGTKLGLGQGERRQRVKASWERIFDMGFADSYVTDPKPKKRLQAVSWYIDPKWVRHIKPFIAR